MLTISFAELVQIEQILAAGESDRIVAGAKTKYESQQNQGPAAQG
jgi:hypothetical protein